MQKIMFNDRYGLTDAVLTGKKTQTRRAIHCPRRRCGEDVYGYNVCIDRDGVVTEIAPYNAEEREIDGGAIMPRYKVGEVLAVAQSYGVVSSFYQEALKYKCSIRGQLVTEFDCLSMKDINNWSCRILPAIRNSAGWGNKMFVKSEFMAHHIRITNIRYERLQDISDEDCIKEGIVDVTYFNLGDYRYELYALPKHEHNETFNTPRQAYASLIDKISGKDTWERNPYVVVYEFEKLD